MDDAKRTMDTRENEKRSAERELDRKRAELKEKEEVLKGVAIGGAIGSVLTLGLGSGPARMFDRKDDFDEKWSTNMLDIIFIHEVLSSHLVAATGAATAAITAMLIVCADAETKVHGFSEIKLTNQFSFLIIAEKHSYLITL